MALTFAQYQPQMTAMLEVNDANGITLFGTILNSMIDYAELRILRDLDLLSTTTVLTYAATVGVRIVTTNPADFVTIVSGNVITPAATAPDAGTRNPLRRVSKQVLDAICPSQIVATTPQLPRYFAIQQEDQTQAITLLIGPTCDDLYNLEFTGTARPVPLYTAPSGATFISTFLPDLFIAASMVYGTGWQRDFGQQADDSGRAESWEAQYQKLKDGALSEEQRKKGWGQAWSAYSATPIQPPRQ